MKMSKKISAMPWLDEELDDLSLQLQLLLLLLVTSLLHPGLAAVVGISTREQSPSGRFKDVLSASPVALGPDQGVAGVFPDDPKFVGIELHVATS